MSLVVRGECARDARPPATGAPGLRCGTSRRGAVAMLQRMQEMVIYGVSFDMVGKQPIVLLKTVDLSLIHI